jgi:hypothetical protein
MAAMDGSDGLRWFRNGDLLHSDWLRILVTSQPRAAALNWLANKLVVVDNQVCWLWTIKTQAAHRKVS